MPSESVPVPVPTGPSTFSGIRALIANYRSGGGTSIRASVASSSASSSDSSSAAAAASSSSPVSASASDAASACAAAGAAIAAFPTRNEMAELADAQDELRAAMDDDAFGGGSVSHGSSSVSAFAPAQVAGEEGGASTLSATDIVLSKKRDLIDDDSDDDDSDGGESASSSSSAVEVLGARLASDKEMDEQWTHVVPRVRIL